MVDIYANLKIALIMVLLIVVSVFHYLPLTGFFGAHILHRELFFFPIVIAGLWFGLKVALFTSACVSLIYAHLFTQSVDTQTVSVGLVGLQVVGFNLMALLTGLMLDRQRSQQKARDFLNETFGKYVSKEVRDEILNDRIFLNGELKVVTILFADLRDFTQLVESLPPREVVSVINTYFEAMSNAITVHHGLVIQFIGDEIEAVFGAPVALKSHQQCGIDAALEIRARLSKVNLELINQGYPPLRHGIGLHTGNVVAANIGSQKRLSYVLVGETVNIASRIQSLNKNYDTDILISDAVRKGIGHTMGMKPLAPLSVKRRE